MLPWPSSFFTRPASRITSGPSWTPSLGCCCTTIHIISNVMYYPCNTFKQGTETTQNNVLLPPPAEPELTCPLEKGAPMIPTEWSSLRRILNGMFKSFIAMLMLCPLFSKLFKCLWLEHRSSRLTL